MKVTLEFNLPEEEEEFDLACKAGKMASALYEIGQALRGAEKYGPDMKASEFRKQFYEIVEGLGMDL